MTTLTVKVEGDHLRTLSHAKKPIIALAELIWNGLDADAQEVSVLLEENSLGGLERIRVVDNGHGLAYNDAIVDFSSLGGSWKRRRPRSKGRGRLLHGRLGKGRFRAFFLGSMVTWQTVYRDNGSTRQYKIVGRSDDPTHYLVSDPVSSRSVPGTQVLIENIHKNFTSLRGDDAALEIASNFALYLHQYPDVAIKYDGRIVTTQHLQTDVADFSIRGGCRADGTTVKATLTIIEWNQPMERSLYLCDSGGFSLAEIPVGIHAPGFNFSAYLKSDYIRELDEEGALELEELHAGIKQLLDPAREKLKAYFRKRASDQASEIVRKWKEEKVYPYEEDPKTPVDQAERQVFDVCALNIHSYLPGFDENGQKSRHLALRLLRTALETNPAAVQTILTEVLDLPPQRQSDFAELLRRTSLDAIITASKTVADRLTFLTGLSLLLFDRDSKRQLLERRQLHRVLAENTWVFGEEFHLTLDDQSLTELLKKHRKELGEEVDIIDEVRREDGSTGIVDLVLGRRIPTPRGQDREHLIVELKRPQHTLNDESLSQIRSYAFAVAADERFRDVHTRWSFWLVSNNMTESVRRQSHLKHLPPSCAYDDAEANIQVWVKTWSELLSSCEGRLTFFQEQLQFRANRADALAYLRQEYRKYLPDVFQKHEQESDLQDSDPADTEEHESDI
jgi:hypothetical protein